MYSAHSVKKSMVIEVRCALCAVHGKEVYDDLTNYFKQLTENGSHVSKSTNIAVYYVSIVFCVNS